MQLKEESTVDRPVSRQESRYNREVRRRARRSFKLNSLRTSLCIGQRISKSHETSSPEFRATMLIATMRSNVTGTPWPGSTGVLCISSRLSARKYSILSCLAISFYSYLDRVQRESSIFFYCRLRHHSILVAFLSVISFDRSLTLQVYWQITRCFLDFVVFSSFFVFFPSFFFFLIGSKCCLQIELPFFIDHKPLCKEYRQVCSISPYHCLRWVQLAISIDIVYRWEKFARAFRTYSS